MVRNVRILGAGYDKAGLFINIRFLDRTTDPLQRVPVTNEQLLGLSRSFLAALEVAEHERARQALASRQKAAS
jgi:hypothetical protein